MRRRLVLVGLLVLTLPLPVTAGIIFGKKPPKPSPQERVPELIKIARTDGDENKRAEAVEELHQYDPVQFPEILPTLIDVVLNDKKPSVRSEAVHSIGKLRPVSQLGGQALETALANDASMRVRIQARSALLSYQWAGYHSKGKKDDPLTTTEEPPLADAHDKGAMPPTVIPARMTPIPQPPLPPVQMQPSQTQPQGPKLNVPPAPVPIPTTPPPPATEPKGPDLGLE